MRILEQRLTLLLCLVLVPFVLRAETSREELRASLRTYLERTYGSVFAGPLPSGVLYDLVVPLSGIEKLNGGAESAATDFATWVQVAHELRRASVVESDIPDHNVFRGLRQAAQKRGTHPLVFAVHDFQRIDAGKNSDEFFDYRDGRVQGMRAEWLATERVVALSALHEWTYHGLDVQFTLDLKNNYFSNLGAAEKIEIDFADGLGYRDVTEEKNISVSYVTTGEKVINSRVTLRTGEVVIARTRFDVRSLDAPPPSDTWTLTASHNVSGTNATGEAYILLAPGHALLERPVVLVEGLDLDNSLNWDELYDLMNQEFLIESLLELGYDAVVLNYGNSTVHVQDNGFLVQELIEEVNSATGGINPVVMVGTSLGGLTTRYALTYMEANSLEHNVSLFLSVDSPQKGANIPIGIQHWANFFADQAAEAAAARDALLTAAPRQLLLYHLSSSMGGTANADPMLATLQNELAAMGDYPSLPRIVSVINGSSTQQNSGFLPGAQILRWVYDSFLVDIRGNVWAVSSTVNTRVLQGEINLIWPLPDEFSNVFIQPCLPWDNAPGGLTATMAELAAVPAPYGDIEALYPSHCFIPSISALDLNTNDPLFNIAGAANLHDLTPFDSLYYPVANQDHVQITPENAEWFINEIVGPLDTPVLTIQADGDSLRLNWTPVFGANSYHVYSSLTSGVWPLTYANTTNTQWATAASDSIGFYQVVAVRE